MNSKKTILAVIYVAIIGILPWLTFSGWNGLLFLYLAWPVFVVLAIFTAKCYIKSPRNDLKWIIILLVMYISACFIIVDGGDGPGKYGIQTFAEHFGVEVISNREIDYGYQMIDEPQDSATEYENSEDKNVVTDEYMIQEEDTVDEEINNVSDNIAYYEGEGDSVNIVIQRFLEMIPYTLYIMFFIGTVMYISSRKNYAAAKSSN